MSTIAAARARARARQAVRVDPEQPVHRLPVPARPRAARRRRDDRPLHDRARPTASSRSASSPADYLRKLAPRAASHGHAPRHRRRAVLAGRRAQRGRDPRAGSACPADAFVALTVRRLFFRNGLDTLLDAAARPARPARPAHRDRRLRARARRDRARASGATGSTNVHSSASSPTPTFPTTTAPPTCSCCRRAPPRASVSC